MVAQSVCFLGLMPEATRPGEGQGLRRLLILFGGGATFQVTPALAMVWC